MNKKERFAKVLAYFEKEAPSSETELKYTNPFELLVAVILSAQCTDKRVNQVTPALFRDFPTAELMAEATAETIFTYIRSVSYPNNKAKHLTQMAGMLVNDFDNRIPDRVDELVKLPGVGRKTANVIASVIYNQPTMAVDTHVFRVSNRIGLTLNSKTPLHTEKELVKYIPELLIPKAHHWLILHGRYICLARSPKCAVCGIQDYCAYFTKNQLKHISHLSTVSSQLKITSNGNKKSKKSDKKNKR